VSITLYTVSHEAYNAVFVRNFDKILTLSSNNLDIDNYYYYY